LRLCDVADDRLAAFSYGNMLHRDLLLAARPVALERLHLSCECPRELVERALGAVLLRYVLDVGQSLSERHGRHVYGGHLRQHRLELLPRLNAFHNGKHEIEFVLVNLASFRTGGSQLI
jgi:hypothetical protein